MSEEVENSSVESTEASAEPSINLDQSLESSAKGEVVTGLPDTFKEDSSLKDFKSVEDLAKSYKHATAKLGNALHIPSEDSSDDQRAAFYEKLSEVKGVTLTPKDGDEAGLNTFLKSVGRAGPESPDHYTFGDDHTEDDYSKSFREFAHNSGLTQEQAKAAMDFNNAVEDNLTSSMAEYGQKTLKETWGSDFDNRIQGANAALNAYKDKYPEAIAALSGSEHINNPAIIAAFSELALSMKEGGVINMGSAPSYGDTPADAQIKIDEIMSNTTHAYYNNMSPEHDAAVQKVLRLREIVANS